MHCDECNKLLSSFMDSDLDGPTAQAVREHLAVCDPCAKICEELSTIVDLCKDAPAEELVPPNPDALWCRINNIIESEVKVEPAAPEAQPRRRFLRFTFPQLTAAVLCVALVSSLLTVIGIRNYFAPASADYTTRSAESQSFLEKLMIRVGLADTPQKARERR